MGIIRENTVNDALEEECSTIEILEYPKSVERVQWSSNFVENEIYLERYKTFKGIADDTNVEIIQKNE